VIACLRTALLLLAMGLPGTALAGTACTESAVTPAQLADASDTARRVHAALEARDAPVALLARAGTDLGKYGLHYSHVGFVVRDHANGRWTVLHLLNRCGTDRSGIYAQGLVNFFLDDLVNQDARIVWLEPAFADRLAQQLAGPAPLQLHEPRYNLISRPDSRRSQNSTAWVLDQLAAARLDPGVPANRQRAQSMQQADGFRSDSLRIPYGKRVLGGLFSANADFNEHPVGTRLAGDYPVVTVRSILRYLEDLRLVQDNVEWRGGVQRAAVGPA